MRLGRTEHPMSDEVVEATPFDWREDGVLWLVNAVVFHPRGFALGMKADGTGPILLGDGSEPIHFVPDDEPTPAEKFAAVEALFARARAGSLI
jgi:hypothetical protein